MNNQILSKSDIMASFLGHAIGDALGVPVEFSTRKSLIKNPVTNYRGYGTWNQPPGTFSDDSSMMFCTAESLCKSFCLDDMAQNFVKWYRDGFWGAHNKVFDIGNTTKESIERVMKGENPLFSGAFFEENNGNGSLMRILPMIFFLKNENDINKRYSMIKKVSSITHAHFRSIFSCFLFVEFGLELLKFDTEKAYKIAIDNVKNYAEIQEFNSNELILFDRILSGNLMSIVENEIQSGGYVLNTLESVIWCLLNSN
ncbi:MAG: ADP-ribosylglycohydrolase family protein [Flavobacteriales bacterium]|jgi:ADP-ribosylglycohydrolase|nr:ADP-ribosylglycohydrolase family protein [Flavobacteriales bacterium]